MPNLDKIDAFARETLASDTTGHDYRHVKRVADWAARFYQNDLGEMPADKAAILLAASLLHDTIDDKVVADVPGQIQRVEKLLGQADFSPEAAAEIMDIITHLSYSANLKEHYQLSPIGQYVQDADRIEALGAIGIARAFAYGGAKGRALADPDILPMTDVSNKEAYRKNNGPTVNHFYEKLFKLPALFNTPAGRQEADKRALYMKNFLRTFNEETGLLTDPAFDLDL